jgi:hypothetical protein
MSEITKEISELRAFVQYLKADRDEQKRKEASERWTKWVSLSIVFLAVGAALASQQHGGFSGKSVRELNQAAIAQGLATNKWSYYQSVSIKLHMYTFEKERRANKMQGSAGEGEALRTAAAPANPGEAEKPKKKAKGAGGTFIDKKIAKYEGQKMKIMAEAREHEAQRDRHRESSIRAQRHTAELTLALAVLQVAIALGSIAVLARKKPLWFMSLLVGAYGIFQTFNGIFLWT